MVPVLLSALAVGFSGAMMPGALLTYTIRQAMAIGPRSGFVIITGHVLLEAALFILIFLGLDIVLKSEAAQVIIGALGGLYLLYIGADMIAGAVRNKVAVQADAKKSDRNNMLLSGFTISALNPNFLMWWAIIGLNFVLQSFRDFGYAGVAVYFTGHIMADYIWYGAVSTIVGKTRTFIKPGFYRVAIGTLGVLIVIFGARFIYSAALTLV